jgi:hypothetical protein
VTGASGVLSATNSLVGGSEDDLVGGGFAAAVTPFPNGNYAVFSPAFDHPTLGTPNVGAVTLGDGSIGTVGPVSNGLSGGNSVLGTVTNAVPPMKFSFDQTRNRLVVGQPASNRASILSFSTTAIADGDLSNPAVWSNGVPAGVVNGVVPAGRTINLTGVHGVGQLRVQCGGSITGASATAYVVGSVRKDFCAATGESFTFPVGDPSNYSPVTASNTTGTGSLTVSATDTYLPGLPGASSLSRHWPLTGSGITTDLTFKYVDSDVNGPESAYRLFHAFGGVPAMVAGSNANAAANTLTATGVSVFFNWGARAPAISATANAAIFGRVLSPDGRGVSGAAVMLTDPVGGVR